MLINPNAQLILDGLCKDGCDSADIVYSYKVYSGVMVNSFDCSWTPFTDILKLFPGLLFFNYSNSSKKIVSTQ
jgi:hypothetical protein